MSPKLKNRYTLFAGIIVSLSGLLVIIGWFANLPLLTKAGIAGHMSMKLNAAFCFLFAGISLLTLAYPSPNSKKTGKLLAIIITIIGLLTFAQYELGRNLGIDELLIKDVVNDRGIHPGRMNSAGAFLFILVGIALILSHQRRKQVAIQVMVFTICIIAALAFIGFTLRNQYAIKYPLFFTIPLHASVLFIILGTGIFTSPYTREIRFSFQWKLVGVIAFIMIVMLTSFFMLNNTNAKFIENTERVERAREVLHETEKIISSAKDIESGTRGYLLTGNKDFLEPMRVALDSVQNDLDVLSALTSDNSTQHAKVDSLDFLIKSQINFQRNIVDLRTSNRNDQAIALVSSGRGKNIMDSIRLVSGLIIEEENRLLNERKDATAKSVDNSINTILIFQLLILLLLILIYLIIQSYLKARSKAEKELRESEEWFATTLSSIGDGVIVTDNEMNVIFMNPVARTLTRWGKEAYGKQVEDIFDIVHEKTRIKVENPIRKVLKEKQIVGLANHTILIRKDKTEISIDDSASPIIDDEGKITGVVLVFRDVTEQKKVEDLIRYNSRMLESISDAIITTDASYKILSLNKNAEKLYGWKERDAIGKYVESLFKMEYPDLNRDEANQKFLAEGSWSGELIATTHNGEKKNVLISAALVQDDEGHVQGTVNIHRDITDLRKTEERTRYNSILVENISDAIISTDPGFKIISWNKAAEELYGFKQDEVIGYTVGEILKFRDREEARRRALAKLHETDSYKDEYEFSTKSGDLKTVLAGVNVIRNNKGELTGYVAVHRDISERRKATERINYLAGLIEQTSDAIFSMYEDDGTVISWNKGAELMYGYNRNEVIGNKSTLFTKNSFSPEKMAEVKEELNRKGNWTGDGVHYDRNGNRIYVYISVTVIHEDAEERRKLVLVIRNVTERIHLEEQLRNFNRDLEIQVKEKTSEIQDMLDRISDGFLALDKDWQFIYLNKKASEIFRMNPEVLVGKNVWEFFPGAIGNAFYTACHKAMETQEYVFVENYSEIFEYWYESHIYPSPNGLSVYFRDVSENRKAEQLLLTSEETRRLIINTAMDAIVCADYAGNITVWNPQAERIFGWTEAEAIGRNLTNTIIPERYRQKHQQGMDHYLATGEGPVLNKLIELYALNKDGKEFPIELTIIPIEQKGIGFFCSFIRDITERKKTQDAIIKEKDFSEKIVDSLPGIFYFFDQTGKFLKWNKQFEVISEYSAEEIATMHPRDFFPTDEQDYISARIMEVFETGTSTAEANFLTRSGKKIPFFFTGSFIDYEGQSCLLGTGIDITERKKTQDAIIEERDFSEKLVDSLPGIFYFFDSKGNFIRWNKQLEVITGYTSEEISKMHPSEFFLPTEKPTISQQMKEVLARGSSQSEGLLITKNGAKIPFYFTGTFLDFNNEPCILGTAIDISERKKIERRLGEERKLLRALIDNLPDYIYVKDDEYRHIINNRANVELLGAQSESETIGKTAFEYFDTTIASPYHEDDKYVFETGKPIINREESIIDKNGQQRWLLTTKVPLLDKNNHVNMLVGISRDITERKKEEKELERSIERFEMISRTTNDAVWEWNMQDNVVWANETHHHLYGLQPQDPIPDHDEWRDRIHPDERKHIVNNLEKTLKSKSNSWIAEYRFLDGEKKYINIYDRTYIVRDKTGQPVRMMGSMMDITARKFAEENLRRNEEKYRLLFSSSPLPMWVYDVENFRILDVNQAAIDHYGYAKDEFLSMTVKDIRPSEEIERLMNFSKIKLAGVRHTGVWKHRKKDGSLIDVEVNAHDINYNNRAARLVLANDITDKIKAERMILETTEQLRQLSSRLQDIREEERMHMAHEIHDELGQRLTVLKMDISWISKNMKEQDQAAKAKVQSTLQLLDGTIKIVRKIATDLRPGILDDLGIISALEWQSKEFENRSGIIVNFQSNISEIALPTNLATGLFRIFQESLTNVGRHAGASEIQSTLIKDGKTVILTISDNGKGFDTSALGSKKTLGIMGMQERTMALGGEYSITSAPGDGTRIVVKVPLPKD